MNQQQDEILQLLLDVPEDQAIFGFDGYASTLTSAIVGTHPHFNIGIFGDWGSGKTTLLRRIEAQLNARYPDKVLTVFFDAWRYQREEHMLLPILDSLSESLKRGQQHWQVLKSRINRLISSIANAMTIKTPAGELEMRKAAERWQQAEEVRSDYYGWLSELQTALEEVRHSDPQRRIVLLIDDLDRCLPKKVIEVLESIKVMLDVSGFVFVLALDQRIVEQAVESYYGEEYGVQGKDYLKKLVQVEFRLPHLRPGDLRDYVRILQDRLGPIEAEASEVLAEVIPSVVGDNPREVKRFINRVLLSMAIIRRAGVMLPLSHQVAFIAMDYRWPGISRILSADGAALRRTRAYIEAKAEGREIPELEEETGGVKAMLDNNPGLESFLERSPGKELSDLNVDELAQLIFYSSITKGRGEAETPEHIIDDILMTIAPRERRIIELRFGLLDGQPRTLNAVGREFGLTAERIRQIEALALRKLRHPSRSRLLRGILHSMNELDAVYQRLLLAVFGPEWEQYVVPK